MSELSRFLRYSLPGSLFLALIGGYLFVTKGLEWLPSGLDQFLTAAAGAGILISTLLGYLFSSLHHTLFPIPHGEYRDIVAAEYPHVPKQPDDLSWGEFNAYWYSKSETSNVIKGATQKSKDLSDMYHSAGASAIASISALLVIVGSIASNMEIYSCSSIAAMGYAMIVTGIVSVLWVAKSIILSQLSDFVRSCVEIARNDEKPKIILK